MTEISTLSQSRIAVVVVNYNGGDFLKKCLEKLAAQSRSPDRVIVVDNNSEDGSNEVVTREFPEIELLQLDRNTGFAAANNRAFEVLRDEQWVALLNPDTLPTDTWLEELESATVTNPDCDIFASKLMNASDPDQIDGAGDVYHVCGLSWRRHHGMSALGAKSDSDPVFSGCGAATLYRVSSVLSAGGFDESYFCYFEDVDLVFRMRLYGSKCIYVESSVVLHHGSGLTGKDSDFTIYHGHRNLVWTFVKNMPGRSFYFYLPQHVLLNIVSLIHYSLKGRAPIIFRAKWDAIKMLSSVCRERKRIQSLKSVKVSDVTCYMVKGFFRPYLSRFR